MPDAGPIADTLAFALRRAQQAVTRNLNAALAADGLRLGQVSLLTVLAARPGLRQTEACAALGMKTTNVVPLLDELERCGLAERRAIAEDRRAKGLFVTEAGAALLARAQANLAAHEARLAARLGADGKAQLLGLLARLSDPAFD